MAPRSSPRPPASLSAGLRVSLALALSLAAAHQARAQVTALAAGAPGELPAEAAGADLGPVAGPAAGQGASPVAGQVSSPAAGPVADPVAGPPAQHSGQPSGQPPALTQPPARNYGPHISEAVDVRGALPTLDWGLAPPTIPPRLVDAISLATQKNPAVAAAWFGVRASHADLRSAKWRRFPTLTTQVNTWSAGANRTAPSLQLGMPIYTFGRIGAAIDKAEADQSLAVAAWRQRVVELALTTSQTYYQYLLASRRTQILRAGVEEHRKLVASMERRVEQEVSPLADLELARTRLAQMQQDLSVAASQADTSLAVLRELIQDPEFDPGEPPAFAPQAFSEDWSGAPAEAVEYDPGRERLRAQALAASREISASRAAIFPQVDAVYSYDDFYGSRVGLALKVQSAGLSQFSQVSGAQARYSQALSQVGDLERQLRQEVSTQVIQNQAARERTSLSSQASDTASRVSGSYVRQFITGRRSWLDVMNALRESVGAQLSETDAAYTVMITNSQLYLRTGKWQPQLQEEER